MKYKSRRNPTFYVIIISSLNKSLNINKEVENMKKIMFTGNTLNEEEQKNYLDMGYQFDPYDVNLSNEEIVKILNDNNYDGYILGGDELLDEKTIKQFPSSLKVISFFGVGYEAYIDTNATTEKGIYVTNTPGTNSRAVAEHTIGLMLSSTRNILFDNTNVKNGLWQKERINDLSGLTIGIVGMGKIGTIVAKILHYSFNATIIYNSRTRKYDLENELGMEYVSLNDLYKRSDLITLHSSLNDQTQFMIDSKAINIMKDNVIIINTSRASLVEPNALYKALETGKIRTIAFDNFYKEPINIKEDKDFKRFLKFNNKQLIITPHTAYFSNQSLKAMEKLAISNTIDILENRKCENIVKEIGNYLVTEDTYFSIALKDYTFIVLEDKEYIDIIVSKLKRKLGNINVVKATSLEELSNKECIKDNTKKILMVYSNLLGEGEITTNESLKNINNLIAISFGCTYLDKLNLDYCRNNNIIVTTLPDYRADLRADLIIYIMQSLKGNITHYYKDSSDNRNGLFPSISLTNMSVGIIGLTDIANNIADKCQKLGMKVTYYSKEKRTPKYEYSNLDTLLSNSNFIVTAGYPGIEEYPLIDEDLQKIKETSYIVSCEQGNSNVNKDKFIMLAESNKISGFGFTSSDDNINNYKGNVFILRDQTWNASDIYERLSNEWVNVVVDILNNKENNLAK